MKKLLTILVVFTCCFACKENPKEKKDIKTAKTVIRKEPLKKRTIQLFSKDSVQITADVYMTITKDNPFILLFHQAGYSRGEYLEIAPKLNKMGFNCMAIDQRSGKEVNGVINQTHLDATAKKLPTKYPDALPDLEAALLYVTENYKPSKLIIWGSSYSSALNFILASRHKDKVDALLSFAPGEYFKFNDKKIEDYAKDVSIPVFITAAKNEEKYWRPIFNAVSSKNKTGFVPEGGGKHGSKALWESQDDQVEYWKAVTRFLETLK